MEIESSTAVPVGYERETEESTNQECESGVVFGPDSNESYYFTPSAVEETTADSPPALGDRDDPVPFFFFMKA